MAALAESMGERGRRAPRTPLRLVGRVTEPVDVAMLVCWPCAAWTPHQRPAGAPPSTEMARSGTPIDDIFECGSCGARRVWGQRWVLFELVQ